MKVTPMVHEIVFVHCFLDLFKFLLVTNNDLQFNFQEMPKLIPTPGRSGPPPSGSTNNNGGHHHVDEDDFMSHGSHSNETLPLNEDPMNLVETSWDISTTLQHNGTKQTSNEREMGNEGNSPSSQPQQSSIPIKN